MKKCSVRDCFRQSKRSPLCRWHYKRWEKNLKKLLVDFNINQRGDYEFFIDFSSAGKTTPEEYMKIVHRINGCGDYCVFNNCKDGGSYSNLCPSHNKELRRYYRAEMDISKIKRIGKLLLKFKKEMFP